MSMFKSLINTSGVITLFYSPVNKASVELLKVLKENAVTGSAAASDAGLFASVFGNRQKDTSGKYKYQLDVAQAFPTAEQFELIKSYAQITPESTEAFFSAFPKAKGDVKDTKIINTFDYDVILGEAAFAQDGSPKSLEELASEGLFQTPLAVDWEHQLLASKIEHLQKILDNYK